MTFWRDSSLVWIGTMLAAALAFVVQVILARHLDLASFGEMTNTYAIASLIGIFGFQGVGEVIMRHPGHVRRAFAIRSFLTLFSLASLLAIAVVLLFEASGVDSVLMLAFVPFVIVHVGLLAGMVDAQIGHRPLGIAAWPTLLQVGRLIGLLIVIAIGGSPILIPLLWAATLLLPGFLGTKSLLRRSQSHHCGDSNGPKNTPAIIRAALPLSTARVIEFAEIQLPVVLTAMIFDASGAGLVAASLTLIQGILLLPIAVFQRLLRARFFQWADKDRRRLVRTSLLGGGGMVLIGLVFTIVGRPFAEQIVVFIFGSEFSQAGDFLMRLVTLLPIWLAAVAVNAALVNKRDADLRAVLQMVGIGLLVAGSISGYGDQPLDSIFLGIALNQSLLLVGGLVILVMPSPRREKGVTES